MKRIRTGRLWRRLALLFPLLVILFGTAAAVRVAGDAADNLVHPPRREITRTPNNVGLANWEEVTFSSDGLALAAWFVPPDATADGAAIIYVHGLGGNRTQHLEQAALFHRYGYGALLIDLRNHGDSEGATTTLGLHEADDVRAAYDYLLTRSEVNPERIGLLGHSMGGATVIMAGARIPGVRTVVAQSAYTSLEDNVAEGVERIGGLPTFPFAPLVVFMGERAAQVAIKEVRPLDDLAQLAGRAIIFVHGTEDPLIKVSNSERMFAAAAEPKALYLVPGAGHGDIFSRDPDSFERAVVPFVNKHMLGG